MHVCLYMLVHTVHTPWGLDGGAGRCGLWQIKSHKIRRMKSEDITLTRERWTNMTSTMNSPGKKSSLERFGAARSFIVVFGTLLLCPRRVSLSNPWQTWIQIHLSTYKDLCSLTDRQGVWYPRPLPLPSHTHSPSSQKEAKGIITCSTIKYIQVCKHGVCVYSKKATDSDEA